MPVMSSPLAKNILLFRLVETAIEPIRPALIRRGVARRHERGVRDAMDALGAQDGRLAKRTAKSCGPDIPTLISSLQIDDLASDGGKKARSPGRVRRKP